MNRRIPYTSTRPPHMTQPAVRTRLPRLLSFIIVVLLVLQVIVSNTLATTGLKISKIDAEVSQLAQENGDLRQQIASASALRTIETKAKELGFTGPAKAVYASKDLPVALDLR